MARRPNHNPRRLGHYSVRIDGHSTSYSIEIAFKTELRAIANRRRTSERALVIGIAADCTPSTLSSAIRVFVLQDALARAGAAG